MKIEWIDVINGEGLRLSIFTAGCSIHCPGCFNKKSWDYNAGEPFTRELKDKIFYIINNPHYNYAGLSILGGEPTDHAKELIEFIKEFKEKCPDKNIWLWSGHTLEELLNYDDKRTELIEMCDVLVLGPFIEELKDLTLEFRGSSNQRIYRVGKYPENRSNFEIIDHNPEI